MRQGAPATGNGEPAGEKDRTTLPQRQDFSSSNSGEALQAAPQYLYEDMSQLMGHRFNELAQGQAALDAKLIRLQETLESRFLPRNPSLRLPAASLAGQGPRTPRERVPVPEAGTAPVDDAEVLLATVWGAEEPDMVGSTGILEAAGRFTEESTQEERTQEPTMAAALEGMCSSDPVSSSIEREPTTRTRILKRMLTSDASVGPDHPFAGDALPRASSSASLLRIDSITLAEKALQTFTLAMGVAYIVFLGVLVDTKVKSLETNDGDFSDWWDFADVGFILALGVELLIFASLKGPRVLLARKMTWETFDAIIFVFALMNVLLKLVAPPHLIISRLLMLSRIARAFRFTRVFKTLRDMRHLRLMIAAILCSLPSIIWATWLLFFVIYLFAVIMLLILTSYDITGDVLIFKYYGGLLDTMLTLFASISGGVDWFEVMNPVGNINQFFARFYFISYVALVLLGIINILTAVFVRNTGHVEKIDRKLVIMEEHQKTSKATAAIKKLLTQADADDDGIITQQELESQLERPETLLYLRRLDIDDADVRRLFMLLSDGKEEVQVREFLVGLLRLRGQAKALDAASLMMETKRRGQEVRALLRYVEDRFDRMPSDIDHHKRIAEYVAEEAETVSATVSAKERIDGLASIGRRSGSELMKVEEGRDDVVGVQRRLGRQGNSNVSERSSVIVSWPSGLRTMSAGSVEVPSRRMGYFV